jgi:2'-5' RNA ligase
MTRSPTARLFVAVDPPGEVCERLVAWAREALRAAAGLNRAATPPRVLDPQLLHVTLCFLGNRPVGEIDVLGAQLATCDAPAGELSVGAPLWLPPRHPRAVAVELHDDRDRLAHLQGQVVAAVGQVSGWQPKDGESHTRARRRFHPHITVARLSRGATPRARALAPTPPLSFLPSELILYRSWLSPQGASYEAVASRPIG